jgi:hypothetical protein
LGWSDANTLRAKKFLHFAIIRARSVGYRRNSNQVFGVSIWIGKGVLTLSAGAAMTHGNFCELLQQITHTGEAAFPPAGPFASTLLH